MASSMPAYGDPALFVPSSFQNYDNPPDSYPSIHPVTYPIFQQFYLLSNPSDAVNGTTNLKPAPASLQPNISIIIDQMTILYDKLSLRAIQNLGCSANSLASFDHLTLLWRAVGYPTDGMIKDAAMAIQQIRSEGFAKNLSAIWRQYVMTQKRIQSHRENEMSQHGTIKGAAYGSSSENRFPMHCDLSSSLSAEEIRCTASNRSTTDINLNISSSEFPAQANGDSEEAESTEKFRVSSANSFYSHSEIGSNISSGTDPVLSHHHMLQDTKVAYSHLLPSLLLQYNAMRRFKKCYNMYFGLHPSSSQVSPYSS